MKSSPDPHRRPLMVLAGISAILALAPSAAWAGPQAGTATWTIQRTPNRSDDFNQLTAITTTSAADAWAVGTFRGPSSPAFRTLIEHFDGASWQAVPSPNVGTSYNELNAVSADSSTDAWAAGFRVSGNVDRTLLERWDGTRWSVAASPNIGLGNNILFGVAALSPTDAWAVGRSMGFVDATVALHWDGTSWTVVPSPSPPNVGGFFTAVTAIDSDDVWAVGRVGEDDATLAEHWDGHNWTIVATPDILGEAFFSGATAIAPDDVWAVGDQGSRTLAEHWNGSAWTIVSTPNPLPTTKGNNFLTAVTALQSRDVWAVGGTLDFTLGELEKTVTMRWDGIQWVVADSPNKGRQSNLLQGVDGTGAGPVIAVGTFRTGPTGTNRTLAMENAQG